jgi:hypothetical protein
MNFFQKLQLGWSKWRFVLLDAYDLEMPIINDNDQVERFSTTYLQSADGSSFIALPKYQFLQSNQTPAQGAELVTDIEGYQLWHYSDSLPFAFTMPASAAETGVKMDHSIVTSLQVSCNGPNRINVVAEFVGNSNQLVVLVSDFPGRKLFVDGKAALLTPINSYLGANPIAGKHTYTFVVDPPPYHAGALISLYSLYVAALLLISETSFFRKTIKSLSVKQQFAIFSK